MFAQRGETGYDEGDTKDKNQKHGINIYRINCTDCEEKGHYAGNNPCSTQIKLKEDAESFRKMKQEKYWNKLPDGGEQKTLVNIKYASCSIILGIPT